MKKFLDAFAYPFKKFDQGLSKLVDIILPQSAQKAVLSQRRLIYGAGVFTAFASIFVAPLATPALIAGALTFNLLASYCEENTVKRKSQSAAPEPAVVPPNHYTASAEDSNFKPNALVQDFKTAQTSKSLEADNNGVPGEQISVIKSAASRAP